MIVRRTLETLCLFTLIGVTALRPLVAETYDSAGNPISRAVEEIADPSPARTLVFDLLILSAACAWLALHATDRSRRYRFTGLELGAALAALAAVVSCFFAGNKRLAINATVDWLCLPVMAIVLVQLLGERWRRELVVAAVLASGCAQAAQCYEQYFWSSRETLAEYESRKAEFWAKQGVEPDSPTVDSFERRLRAREATGFASHGNVAASHLLLCGFAGAGWVAGRWRRGEKKESAVTVVGAILVLAMLVAMALTGSLGAMIAGAAGAALWAARIALGRSMESCPKRALAIGWLCVAGGAASTIGHGLYRDSLPGWSLTFRWQYWKASTEMIAEHPWTGVGRENFGRHYLKYKSIESPEEVSNPHNMFVQTAADWGVVGLGGFMAMLVGGSLAAARPRIKNSLEVRDVDRSAGVIMVGWTVGLLLVVTLLRSRLLGTSEPNFVYYSTVTTGVCWLMGFVVFRKSCANEVKSIGCGWDSTAAIGAGLFAFLLHETIHFALFVPATGTTFCALLGVWLSDHETERRVGSGFSTTGGAGRWMALTAAIALTVGVAVGVLAPVAKASRLLATARSAMGLPVGGGIESHPAYRGFEAAAAADPLDPTPLAEKAKWLAGAGIAGGNGEDALRRGVASLVGALQRDPYSMALWQAKSRMEVELASRTGRREDYEAAVASAESALALYPRNPSGLAMVGEANLAAGKGLESAEYLEKAIERYESALSMDERRLAWEEIRRLRPRQVEAIRGRIEEAKRALSETAR